MGSGSMRFVSARVRRVVCARGFFYAMLLKADDGLYVTSHDMRARQ